MIKVLFIIFLLVFNLNARENPFFPASGDKNIPYTSNEHRDLPRLKQVSIKLPSKARIIQKVTIKYKNLDGSLEEKSIDLKNSVDWHLPVFVSQNYTPQEDTKKQEKKSTKVQNFKKIAQVNSTTIFTSNKTLKIQTKDKMIRNFLLVQPHRIVADFRSDKDVKSFIVKNLKGIFTKVRVGNHSGYYRVVVELDGYYRYRVQKTPEGYLFELK